MTATLTMDEAELRHVLAALDAYHGIQDFRQWLRNEIKHNGKPWDEVYKAFFDFVPDSE
jgi:hypothetical protein